MPFEIPNLPALISRAEADLEALASDALRRSDARVLARVHAAATYGLHGHLGHISRQILPDSCDEDVLARWAAMRGVPRWAAVAAQGPILVRGAPGSIVGRGRIFQRGNGQQYWITEDTVIEGSGPTAVPTKAVVAGAAGNAEAGTRLSLVSPIVGVLEQAEVAPEGIVSGLDQESVESWRARVIETFRREPHGGAVDDYVMWARRVPGVTRAWSVPGFMGPGTVGVFFVRDLDEDILPSSAQIAEVAERIEAERPATAEIYVMAPTLLPVTHSIELLPDSELLRMRVERSLRDLYDAEAELGGRVYLTHIAAAISNTAGEIDHRVIAPTEDITPSAHELPVFGGIEWL